MHYVLFLPYGHSGWTIDSGNTNSHSGNANSHVSTMQFYAYHLIQRDNFNILLRGGRLLQQYIVDMFAKIEQLRLNYCFYHQNDLRAELYQGLNDAVHAGDVDGVTVGRKIILPSSFTGSPRNMYEQYQDAMSIVRRFGKPDLFITFTCNPKWPEIVHSLLINQTPADRPDLITRVFKQKLQMLLHDITQNNVFGKTIAYVYVIEFQKRGLPHSHILLILQPNSKPLTPDHFDDFVSAEIPDPALLPNLHHIVTQHMIHGPCGKANKQSPCMNDGKCSKGFPKDFNPATLQTSDGYPLYKRRDNGLCVEKNGVILDNRWVVPYNPYLCTKYSAHINVEICSTVKAVKYLYKYVYKGHDKIMVGLQKAETSDSDQKGTNVYNEITHYVDARYVSASEACWRIFHYDLHTHSPAIQRLAVHLPGQEQVICSEGKAQQALQHNKNTTLTGWFKINQTNPLATTIPYHLFPEHFTWNQSSHTWAPRKKGNVIGRLYRANPAEGERFFLRLLLHHCPGATCYEDLRKLEDGTVCTTFKETAMRRGFLQHDEEWVECLTEAAAIATPTQIRLLFVTILLFCEPSEPAKLWEQFKDCMSEDIVHNMNNNLTHDSKQFVCNKVLCLIQQLLKSHGKNLADFPGFPNIDESNITFTSNLLHEQCQYKIEEQTVVADKNESLLNSDQHHVYQKVVDATEQHTNTTAYFEDGPGGSGKTFLYNTILARIRSKGKIALAVASSGIAAELLEGGRTAHSRFKIPIPISETSTCNISRNSALANLIKNTAIIVWDEAPMIHKHVLECVHRTLCDITQIDKPFGGKVVLLGGDFRQVLPVIRHGTQAEIINSNIMQSFLWESITMFNLTINMRVRSNAHSNNQADFENFLLRIGNGKEKLYPNVGSAKIQLPKDLCICPDKNGLKNLTHKLYGDILESSDYSKFTDRAILTTTNDDVDTINTMVMDMFPSTVSKTYLSADTVEDESTGYLYPTEFLNTITPSGTPPHKLTLKKTCTNYAFT